MSLPKILFVTGTDTDCGKTTIAKQLLTQLSGLGLNTIGLKPIVSGGIDDVEAVCHAASIPLTVDQCNVYRFAQPIAPHIAAAINKTPIFLDKLIEHVEFASSFDPDIIVIEGAGGWMVPLNDSLTFADYVRAINAEVLLVVGMKLGCINHSLLTVRAMEQDQVKLFGWVANVFDDKMPVLKENIATLDQAIKAPRLDHNSFSSLTVA